MRYDRQLLLPEIGKEGQQKLAESRVLIVGAGGLGSPIALYLTAAGIGTLGIIDNDVVSITNLQRQILYTEEEENSKKVICARKRLNQLNSTVTIQTYPHFLTDENAARIISQYDIVVDACDNFATRYLINDTCVSLNKPYVYGAIYGFEGQVSVFNYHNGPTYRDIFPDKEGMLNMPPLSKGVIGVTPAITGTVEASEVIKIICGFGEVLSGKLWTVDLRTMQTHLLTIG